LSTRDRAAYSNAALCGARALGLTVPDLLLLLRADEVTK
jgi:hypothetical protein